MRTLVKNGLILFAQNGAHVLKIRIRGSKLQVLYQVGNGEVEIEEADYDVSDRELHTVTLTENLTNMTLAITGPHRNISKDFTFRHSPTVHPKEALDHNLPKEENLCTCKQTTQVKY